MAGDGVWRALVAGALAVGGLLPARCSEDEPTPTTIAGERVARMVEAQLKDDHPQLSPGTLSCPDLEFAVGESTRCVRTALLSRGRQVRVLGTISVTSTAVGGRLHVLLDQEATGFGLTGDYLAERLQARVRRQGKVAFDEVDCPDLPGEDGARVICEVSWESGEGMVPVEVTALDPTSYEVGFRFGPMVVEAQAVPG